MSDSAELNRLLLERFGDVCKHLLPNGKETGNIYSVGSISGEAGASLQITLSGSAAGRFKDFKTGEGGATPLWLWSKARGITFAKACGEAKEYLGIKDTDFGVKKHKAKEWALPTDLEKAKAKTLAESNSASMDYLTIERRLNPSVVVAARIADHFENGFWWAVLPYFDGNEQEPFHIKRMRILRENGKKVMTATKGTRRSLYGKHLIDENVSEITISEGEIDALSFHTWAIPAVSVPNGVNDDAWIDEDWDWLARFERINLCMDMDEAGRAAAQTFCKRLGLHRCFIVSLPKKDANECLVAGMTRDEILKCIEQAKQIDLEEIKKPVEYSDEVHDYYDVDWSARGWSTPWYPELPWRVREAEFTILSGFSGSGKTVALNQLMLHLVQQGCKVMDASLEIKPAMTLYNITRCALGKDKSSRAEIDGCIDWLNESIFFLDIIGTANVKRLLSAMEYARKRHGINVFIIDSLFKCGLDPNDYGAQRAFADELTSFCNNTGAHVILVAHARKTMNGNELSVPSKSDVSGSSDLTNAAFNVVIWWRNKMKKRKLDEARSAIPPDNETIAAWIDQPDGKAVLDKQRFGEGEEAEVRLWFQRECYQFHTSKTKKTHYFQLR